MRGWARLVLAVVMTGGCGDDGSSSSGGDTLADGGPGDGGPGDGGPGDGGGGPCSVDDDCAYVACCSCQPVTTAQDCSGLGCPSPDCTGLTAVCNDDGTCSSVLANCDPATVACDMPPPECPGMIPGVVDGCWSGQCVWLDNCDPACTDGRCPWACPQGGDALTTVSGTADQLVVESGVDGKQYDCTLSFDEPSDAFDCTTLATPGASATVTAGTQLALACVPGSGMFAIPLGDPQQCTLSCSLSAGA